MSNGIDGVYGETLATARTQRGLSRQALARLAGIDASHLYRIEKGKRNPPRRTKVIEIGKAMRLRDTELNAHLLAAGYVAEPVDQIGNINGGHSRGSLQIDSSFQVSGPVHQPVQGHEHSSRPHVRAVYQDTVLRTLSDTLNGLPSEIYGSVIASLSDFSNTFETLNRLIASSKLTDAGSSKTGFTSSQSLVEVACIPVTTRQWNPRSPDRICNYIGFTADEAIEAGALEIVVVLPADYMPMMRAKLARYPFTDRAQVRYVAQSASLGSGLAILESKAEIGDRPFTVLLPDDEFYPNDDSLSRHLQNAFSGHPEGAHIVALTATTSKFKPRGVAKARQNTRRYRALDVEAITENPIDGQNAFEMNESSNIVYQVVGRYILLPSIFEALDELDRKRKNTDRLDLGDAIQWIIENSSDRVIGLVADI